MTANHVIRTSQTHTMRIDCVQPAGNWGLIGMSFCPGKSQVDGLSGHWERSLAEDIAKVKAWGASIVVSLIESHEFSELQVNALPTDVEQLGMAWRHLPIRDRYPPGYRFDALWDEVGAELVAALQRGGQIFIHCKGGLGRTGTIAACLLIESGIPPAEAIKQVRTARRMTIETSLQEWYVHSYTPRLVTKEQDDAR
ncbi:MAG: cyclin-dependent kinase inhibitor 3 family protein [Zoogloea sp.]|nr:cyclin-dependent kinase inhibitor 3 family protein [Zoogloea sp.]